MTPQKHPPTAKQLLRLIQGFNNEAPLTAALHRGNPGVLDLREKWIGWLREYDQRGYYGRRQPGRWARQAYCQIKAPWMLAWLCEQLGVPNKELRAAVKAADVGNTKSASAGAFRAVVAWNRIEALLSTAIHRAASSSKGARPRRRIETPRELRRRIASLSSTSPVTDSFSAKWHAVSAREHTEQEQKNPWYRTQHEHWLGWLDGQNGPGAYGRKNWNRSAMAVYNHIVNPQMLVYLAEAAKMDRQLIAEATDAAFARRAKMSSMSAAIRRVIPWKQVESVLLGLTKTGVKS